ncbi:hypothetical protein KJ819_01620 [Patescibacteria group bacterium]|nr:hypothetical protein [Patescibacteria group bacterium]MBU1501017.1 hypothetical protein [Patescibacteria group bacterium]MBU2080647.1 hypothetical protein [Patescibacteria group bacterium]MBU2124278.1 hypothetical protein [Patescibacteria group bacterium]MBU2194404.1 hypothetical protein [Patescibacteria group bacterium]
MRSPDVDRIRCEKQLSMPAFLEAYNEDLPEQFPKATAELLVEFKKQNTALFKQVRTWSLDQHRKKVMDWLPAHTRVS